MERLAIRDRKDFDQMPDALSRDEQWDRLKVWLAENIAAIERGDLERLPSTFTGDRGDAAAIAYDTCLEAMKFLENWDKFGLDSPPTVNM